MYKNNVPFRLWFGRRWMVEATIQRLCTQIGRLIFKLANPLHKRDGLKSMNTQAMVGLYSKTENKA